MNELSSAYTTEQFFALECVVWDALVAGDSEADAEMLEDDFLGVYTSGFEGKQDHVGQLRNGPTVLAYELLQQRCLELSEGLVLYAYRAEFRRVGSSESSAPESMYVSSIWRQRGGRWRNVFSQDTQCKT